MLAAVDLPPGWDSTAVDLPPGWERLTIVRFPDGWDVTEIRHAEEDADVPPHR